MNKNMKRAFTITELVIVIAVVAILAAVLIPTFSNLIEKANVSNDTVLVRNLNEALIIAETTEGKPQTMHDALTAVAEQGYTVEKLTPRSTGHILWEQTSNRFVLVDSEGTFVLKDDATKAELGYTYWKITSNLKEVSTGEYSYYLADEVDESVLTEALAVSTGIDVGNNSNVSISYTNSESGATAQNVIFRTNGGELTVNGSKDTVSHYGTANVVEIKAVAGNSYHEYGTILGNISLKQGRVVLENKSEVSSVVVTATSLDNVAIEDKSGNNTTVAATNKTVSGQLATSDKISGTTNVQETAVDGTQMSLFAGGIGTEASPYLIETVEQFMNMNEEIVQERIFTVGLNFKLLADIDFSKIDLGSNYYAGKYIVKFFNGVFDGNGHKIIGNNSLKYIFSSPIAESIFRDLTIEFDTEMITFLYDEMGVILLESTGDVDTNLTKVGLTFDNVDYKASERNLDKYYDFDKTMTSGAVGNIGLYDINTPYAYSYNESRQLVSAQYPLYALVENDICKAYLTLLNCDVYANLAGGANISGSAVFLGGQTCAMQINLTDCSYNGIFIGGNIGLVFANASNTAHPAAIDFIKLSNVYNNGTFIKSGGTTVDDKPIITFGNSISIVAYQKEMNGVFAGSVTKPADLTGVEFTYDENGKYTVSGSDKYVYKIKIHLGELMHYTTLEDFNNKVNGVPTSDYQLVITVSVGEIDIYKGATPITLEEANQKKIITKDEFYAMTDNQSSKYAFVEKNGQMYFVVLTSWGNGDYAEFSNKSGETWAELLVYNSDGVMQAAPLPETAKN